MNMPPPFQEIDVTSPHLELARLSNRVLALLEYADMSDGLGLTLGRSSACMPAGRLKHFTGRGTQD